MSPCPLLYSLKYIGFSVWGLGLYIYIYIYIEREREREEEGCPKNSLKP
jgi:hypothetical protein